MKRLSLVWLLGLPFLLGVAPFPHGYRTLKDDVNVRVDSTSMAQVIATLKKGEEVEVLEERYEWYRIRLPRRFTCYASAQFLEDLGAGKRRVGANILNLRSAPTQQSDVVGKAQKGDILNIIEKKAGWYKVVGYPYMLGWAHKNFFKPIQERYVRQEGVILYLKQRDCQANCLLKSDQKYPLKISSPRYQKFINKRVKIVGKKMRDGCEYLLVKKISFKR
ncbi:MAG: SH3 domain-containing protein [Candidatus Omnitrophica bacterium]|nr:SH3 domain-containing protein [Candidatus Omnitrophota bacterium]